jgi:hypothetical protein
MFMEIDIRGNEENRTLDFLKKTGQDKSPGSRGESLKVGLPRFPTESLDQMPRSRAGG